MIDCPWLAPPSALRSAACRIELGQQVCHQFCAGHTARVLSEHGLWFLEAACADRGGGQLIGGMARGSLRLVDQHTLGTDSMACVTQMLLVLNQVLKVGAQMADG